MVQDSFIQEPAAVFTLFRRDLINSVPEIFPSQGVDSGPSRQTHEKILKGKSSVRAP
jgi:hypothetical protein